MIVKKVKFTSRKPKSKAWQIGDLVDYIRSPRDVNPLEKIEHGGSRGFIAASHAGQKKEMIGLASESAHSRMPVSHWIFSWKEHEQPTPEQVDEVVNIFLERMGLAGHQTIYGLHFNTENYHVHIAVIFVGEIAVKASSVDRAFSMGKLCKRLGEFVPGEYEDGRIEPIAPEPVSPAHLEDWKEYRAERAKATASVQQPDPQQATANLELKTRHTQERKQLARRLVGKPFRVINRARHELAVKQREERKAVAVPRPLTRSHSGRKRPSFKAWLKAHGRNRQADRWRYRNRSFSATPPPPPPVTPPSEALAAYVAHWEIQEKKNARLAAMTAGMALFNKIPSTQPESLSRLDARVALLMRAEGHSRGAVAEAIRRSAPELRQEEKRDWRRYAARTAGYAFGLGGDMELTRMGQAQRIESKPMESPKPLPEQFEDEAWRERPRLRMR